MAFRTAGFTLLALFWFQCSHREVSANTPLFLYGDGDDVFTDISRENLIHLPFNISVLDHKYSTLIVSADGTVAFENNKEVAYVESLWYFGGVRNPSVDVPFIAPLLYKAYRPLNIAANEYQGRISYRVVDARPGVLPVPRQEDLNIVRNLSLYLPQTVVHAPTTLDVKFLIVITWDNVAEGPEAPGSHECRKSSPCSSATFQLALAGNDSYTFAIFNYANYNISVKSNYEAGINAGKGRGWYSVLPCHGAQGCQTVNVSNLPYIRGSDLAGRYIFSVAHEAVIRGGCLARELTYGILEVSPRAVGMFGGEKLEVSGVCGTPGAVIYCRFGPAADPSSQTVNGTMINAMKGYCPVPPLATAGHLDLYMFDVNRDGTTYHSINVVLPSRLDPHVAIDKSVKEQWYQRDSREITVKWNSFEFSQDKSINVDIKLIGYKELEKQVEYKELKRFGSTQVGLNSFTFNVEENRCQTACEDFEIGLLEVSLPPQYHPAALERVAVRYGPVPLGWYINQELSNRRGSDWSNQKCREWHETDSKDTTWIKDLPPCPCTLQQALADFGRWQADPGCNLFTGSQCTFHQGSKHCVRSVAATGRTGAGNQCCYNSDGSLRHSQLSYQGSTPDRSHVWGVRPYNSPGRVPELSHWRHDVSSFFYCCLWNNYELCDLYMELRPTTGCQNYDVPGIGFVYGQTHLKTFDGLRYHQITAGDFWLVNYEDVRLYIQGKFQPPAESWDFGKRAGTSSWYPQALTGVAISGGNQKIEVSVALEGIQQKRGLDVRVDGKVQYFLDKSSFWQNFEGCAIVNNAARVEDNRHDNFTILLTSLNVGINVVASNGLLQVTVALPPGYKPGSGQKPKVVGLLGAFDGAAENDFLGRRGDLFTPTKDNPSGIYDRFISSWKLLTDDYKIFRFENPAEDLDQQHAYFEVNQIPSNFSDAPPPARVGYICVDSSNCKWDYQISGKEDIAKATKSADDYLTTLQRYASQVDSCGLPEVGVHASLSTENFFPGAEVRVKDCKNGQSFSSDLVFRCLKESVDEAKRNDRAGYGSTRTNVSSGETYIVHWVPQPYTLCQGGVTDEASNLPLIIGVTVGGVVLIAIIVVIVVVVLKKRKSGQPGPKEKTASQRRNKEVEADPGSAEAMLSRVEGRSPVYKPSKEPVRMSEIQGSNV
ncbi:hypothetical protein BsWGS_18017 [Bradybaena similaris]